jgi:hypothetical protein
VLEQKANYGVMRLSTGSTEHITASAESAGWRVQGGVCTAYRAESSTMRVPSARRVQRAQVREYGAESRGERAQGRGREYRAETTWQRLQGGVCRVQCRAYRVESAESLQSAESTAQTRKFRAEISAKRVQRVDGKECRAESAECSAESAETVQYREFRTASSAQRVLSTGQKVQSAGQMGQGRWDRDRAENSKHSADTTAQSTEHRTESAGQIARQRVHSTAQRVQGRWHTQHQPSVCSLKRKQQPSA